MTRKPIIAGNAPTKYKPCHPQSGTISPNKPAPNKLPIADNACIIPKAPARAFSGITSATKAAPTANSPPTPKPVKKRPTQKKVYVVAKPLNPVKAA